MRQGVSELITYWERHEIAAMFKRIFFNKKKSEIRLGFTEVCS